MKNWMSVGIRYEKTMENGVTKKVNETILVDAMSFTEAEARAIEEMRPFIRGEFSVQSIKKESYEEVMTCNRPEADIWYKVKFAYITLDEKSGNEKKTYSNMMIQSENTANAEKDFNEVMKGTMSDYEVVAVQKTKVEDVFFYQPDEAE